MNRAKSLLVCAAAVAVWCAVSVPRTAGAQCLGEGFKEARWGMGQKDLQRVIPGLREDINRFERDVVAFHSFRWPNNGFSEFRLFRDKLFYIRVKITNPSYNEQLLQSMQRCGQPLAKDQRGGARRYMWKDDKTALAIYLYPNYGEIRAKSVKVAEEWAALHEESEDVDAFLDQQLGDALSGGGDLSEGEIRQLEELRKSLQTAPSDSGNTGGE